MNPMIDVLDSLSDGVSKGVLDLVRLGPDEVALLPFTSKSQPCRLHYVAELEVRGYVHCNGAGCVLCLAGREIADRRLMPVYVPSAKRVGVLPMSPSLAPRALLPQIGPLLKEMRDGGIRFVCFIRRQGAEFVVSHRALAEDVDDGAAIIKAFQEAFVGGEIDLFTVYPQLDNEALKAIPGIASMLRLKGLME